MRYCTLIIPMLGEAIRAKAVFDKSITRRGRKVRGQCLNYNLHADW